ncbi:MAG: GNAT superfamily N-acetyltransferase [Parasphingorhabdus sp.]|jgi:GNAT superfamily N-acetyltransferase
MNYEANVVMAKPTDSDIVGELVYALLFEFYADQSHLFSLDKMKKTAAELLGTESGVWSFLAMSGDEVVGMINLNECSAIYAGGKFGEITELYIKPEFRSQNIGEELISQAKRFAKERRWNVLEVGAPNVPRYQRTVNFYLKNGFSEIGPRLELDV